MASLIRGYYASVNRPFEEPDPLVRDGGGAISAGSPVSGNTYATGGFSYNPVIDAYQLESDVYRPIANPITNYAQNRFESAYMYEPYGMLGSHYAAAIQPMAPRGGTNFYGGDNLGINVTIDYDLARKQAIMGTPEWGSQQYRNIQIQSNRGIAAQEAYDFISNNKYTQGWSNERKNEAFNNVVYPFGRSTTSGAKTLTELYSGSYKKDTTGPFTTGGNHPYSMQSGHHQYQTTHRSIGTYDTYGRTPSNPGKITTPSSYLNYNSRSGPQVYTISSNYGVRSSNPNFRSSERLFSGGIIQGPRHIIY